LKKKKIRTSRRTFLKMGTGEAFTILGGKSLLAYTRRKSGYNERAITERTDKYGGSMDKRVTIVREIVAQVHQRISTDFPILIKMNCNNDVEGGIDINSFPALANEIAKTGVDTIEVSGNDTCRTELDDIEKQSYYLKYIERLNLDIPVILTGGNKSVELIEKIAQEGKVDFFGFARPLIREPNLSNRWLEGIGGEECTCISCNNCLNFLGKGSATRCRIEQ
jgi:2,4-dienoyl-CoA reductase-like NADH-dependent reductase (Old Yellow Enzyme family)